MIKGLHGKTVSAHDLHWRRLLPVLDAELGIYQGDLDIESISRQELYAETRRLDELED